MQDFEFEILDYLEDELLEQVEFHQNVPKESLEEVLFEKMILNLIILFHKKATILKANQCQI